MQFAWVHLVSGRETNARLWSRFPHEASCWIELCLHASAFSRRDFARALQVRLRLCEQRAQGMPGARCTRGLVCQKCALRRTRAYRAAETLRHPLRNGFTAYFVLSPVERACCHRHLRKTSTGLTPASRRQDHTTSPYENSA